MNSIMEFILTSMDLNPKDYEECKHCQGYGSSFHEESLKCTKCGGNGYVKTG